MAASALWEQCLVQLQNDIPNQQFNTWIRPLHVVEKDGVIHLLAPNRFVLDWVSERFLDKINNMLSSLTNDPPTIQLTIGSRTAESSSAGPAIIVQEKPKAPANDEVLENKNFQSNLNPQFTFKSFVEGKSNQLARAAALQVAENPGKAYNPLFL